MINNNNDATFFMMQRMIKIKKFDCINRQMVHHLKLQQQFKNILKRKSHTEKRTKLFESFKVNSCFEYYY
jgi:hypothetical protein